MALDFAEAYNRDIMKKGHWTRMSGWLVIPLLCFTWSGMQAAENGVLRIIVFGAHPDDCELKAGGVGALWAAKGHKVKFVSATNGVYWPRQRGRRAIGETADGGSTAGRQDPGR